MKATMAETLCKPCKEAVQALRGADLEKFRNEVGPEWEIVGEHQMEKQYVFKNFKEALAFTNKVGALAEQLGHHPEIYLAWGRVTLILWTHKVDGLTERDFTLAAKADKLL